ncbi:Bifunctional epoxide hydrolase 2 [Hypsizygus marmoreus]|uniref:Bifunctional epoxide hydrolase 2 n=1 Tax=Hypsizygus marmoreus TaxID=39966 RepID=A0A369KE32_HYPMA|nr:Bifunctional epoxide hydrolase 2 [Hypsizygus marmoreus]
MSLPSSWPGLSPAIESRSLLINDLNVHILEARPASSPTDVPPPPLLILLHGFPELAYSWRKVMVPLAQAGYHVVAPDQRGYGRTKLRTTTQTHDKVAFEDDLAPYRMLNLVTDLVALVYALGYREVASVVGHDFGSAVAGHCALIRPDLFKSVVMMSAPYTGAPVLLPDQDPPAKSVAQSVNEALAMLRPPRKHYTVYYSTSEANANMTAAPQGLHAFLRAYYHVKSADWQENQPYPLPSLDISSLALLPNYYIMPLNETMAEAVAQDALSASEVEKNNWLTEKELDVYVSEYATTGFQGGLNWYRCATDTQWSRDLRVFSGKRIEVPAMFVSGKQDWGVFQYPGAAEKMRTEVCQRMEEEDFVLVEGAGHWVQQERPGAVVEHLLRFLKEL